MFISVMENAQTVYKQTVLPLSEIERLRLATMILQDLSGNVDREPQHAFDLLQDLQSEGVFSTAEEVDEHLQAERESWDN